MLTPTLQVRGVERRFESAGGSMLALEATNLDVAENDFVTILGPSGCGKSTLLLHALPVAHGARQRVFWPA
jgi:ABC-type nitrate/sulfonate/bicarbonate transport system ATPase subunit